MSHALPAAREAFRNHEARHEGNLIDPPRPGGFDSLIKWSVARPQLLAFGDDSAAGVLAFKSGLEGPLLR
jgi:hypothetical protein